MEAVAPKIGYEKSIQLVRKRNGPRMEFRKSYPNRFLKDDGEGHVEKNVKCTLEPENISISLKMILGFSGAIEWLKSRHFESRWDRFT